MVESVPLGREVKGAVVGKPSLAAGRAAEPCDIVIRGHDAGLRGGGIERKDPATLVVRRTTRKHTPASVFGEIYYWRGSAASARSSVHDLRGGRADFTMIHVFHFA